MVLRTVDSWGVCASKLKVPGGAPPRGYTLPNPERRIRLLTYGKNLRALVCMFIKRASNRSPMAGISKPAAKGTRHGRDNHYYSCSSQQQK